MPRPFLNLSVQDFVALLQRFPFRRRIDAVHMHHTFIPRQTQFRGEGTIEAMRRDHVVNRGFSDIAQHITIAPDGTIWTGRAWDQPPASAVGHNGNSVSGPFMFETVGNFDAGQEALAGAQRETVLTVIAQVQKRFQLPAESLRFHNQMSQKTCPGTSIPYAPFLEEVRAKRRELEQGERGAREARAEGAPFGTEHADPEGGSASPRVQLALEVLARAAARGTEPDGEPDEDEMDAERRSLLAGGADYTEESPRGGRARGGRAELSAEEKAALRPHVINLREGRLIRGGDFFTLEADVEAIFGEHLERAVGNVPAGEKLPVILFAHGGLVPEGAGLAIARKHVDWWLANGVYPIYFVWETGFLQTVGQLLRGALPRGLAEELKDNALERLVRLLQGKRVWSGMKRNAEIAAVAGNGADFTARQLKAFCDRHAGRVELHAIGHSAGSIFHAHFLEAARRHNVSAFESGHFLAPAIRVDTFLQLLEPHVGSQLEHLTMYTMKTDFELEDHCARIYSKSLLYLIFHALEEEEETDLLGLEESLRRNDKLKKLFGLGGSTSKRGEVVFSKTLASSGRSASQSTTHGGFDDDPPTMNSVARRVLGLADSAALKQDYPRARAAEPSFEEIWGPPDLLAELGISPAEFTAPVPPPAAPALSPAIPALPSPVAPAGAGGARKALCVGINAYAQKPLSGCVADARLWESTLQAHGFATTRLLDEEATWERLRAELRTLVTTSRAGDVLVFQYSGHGTEAPDLDGDEEGGPDQALCPVDFDQGRLLIDDDISEILAELPAGVNFTFFMDNCFSGDVSRIAFGRAPRAAGEDARARFLPMTDDVEQAHAEFRRSRGGSRALARGGRRPLRGVLFAACQPDELAWEVNGQGEFTARAVPLLRGGIVGVTNQVFFDRVVQAFGAMRRQTPALRATDDLLGRGLLAPLDGAGGGADLGAAGALLADELQRVAQRLRGLHG